MSDRPPTALRAIAAATTPVVAAAFLAIALLATGCDGRLPAGSPRHSAPSATGASDPTGTPGAPPSRRLVVAAGAPAAPRLVVHDLAGTGGAGTPITPPAVAALGALAAAPDGSLAVVAPDGRGWQADVLRDGDAAVAWRPLGRVDPPGGAPGSVLGAAWTSAGDALIVTLGAPGSGLRRTVVAALAADGSVARSVTVAAEPDGPGLAALPGGDVLLVLRDAGDSAVLARVTAAGAVTFLPQAARAVASDGDLVAVADDAGVLVGTLAALGRGSLPAERLPLAGDGGVAGLAVTPDGAAVAVVRLDDAGSPARIDVLERTDGGWRAGPSLPVDPATGNVLLAWMPGP